MTDTRDLKNLISGFEGKLVELRNQKDLFTKAQGLDEQAEKLRADAQAFKDSIPIEKEALKVLQDQKAFLVSQALAPMTEKMNALLPHGKAFVKIEDGGFDIGWYNGKTVVPHAGLSGGERAAFDPALCKALGGSVLIVEAAEMDKKHFTKALERYTRADMQVIVSSHQKPLITTEGWEGEWKVVTL